MTWLRISAAHLFYEASDLDTEEQALLSELKAF